MKKLIAIACILGIGLTTYAGPRFVHHIPVHRHGPRILPSPHHYHHRHYVGPFVGGMIGGLIGSTIINSVRPAPVVVTQPPVVVQTPTQIWVEGRYVQQVVNGITTTVWQPGHWETVYP